MLDSIQYWDVFLGVIVGLTIASVWFNQSVLFGDAAVHDAPISFRRVVKEGLNLNSSDSSSLGDCKSKEEKTLERLRRLGFSDEIPVELAGEVVLPQDLESEIQKLSDLTVTDFVSSWFGDTISMNPDFPNCVNQLIQGVLSRIVEKLIRSDSVSFVFLDVSTAFRMLFRLFVDARAEIGILHPRLARMPDPNDPNFDYAETLKARTPLLMKSLMLSNLLHPACFEPDPNTKLTDVNGVEAKVTYEQRGLLRLHRKESYLRHLCQAWVPMLMDERDSSSETFVVLVRELVTCCVLLPALGAVCPDLINNIMLSVTKAQTEEEEEEAQEFDPSKDVEVTANGKTTKDTTSNVKTTKDTTANRKTTTITNESLGTLAQEAELSLNNATRCNNTIKEADSNTDTKLQQDKHATKLHNQVDGSQVHTPSKQKSELLLSSPLSLDPATASNTITSDLLSTPERSPLSSTVVSSNSALDSDQSPTSGTFNSLEETCESHNLNESFESELIGEGRSRSKAVPELSEAQHFAAVWGVHRVAAHIRSAQLTVDTRKREGSTPYVAYVIECGKVGSGGRTLWTIKRRYSQFYSLHNRLKKSVKEFKLKLPSRQVLKFVSAFDRGLVETRRTGLDAYVAGLLKHPWAYSNQDVKAFFAPAGYEQLQRDIAGGDQAAATRLPKWVSERSIDDEGCGEDGTPSFSRTTRLSVTSYSGNNDQQNDSNNRDSFRLNNWIIEQAKAMEDNNKTSHGTDESDNQETAATCAETALHESYVMSSKVENSLFRVLQEVLHIRELGIFRRKLIGVLRTIVRYSFLGRLYTFLEMMSDPTTKSNQWKVTLASIRELVWPNGKFIEAQDDYTVSEKRDLYYNSRQLLLDGLPKPLMSLVGAERSIEAVELLHEFVQYPELVDNLLYTVLDLLLVRTYGIPVEEIHNDFIQSYTEPTLVSELPPMSAPSTDGDESTDMTKG